MFGVKLDQNGFGFDHRPQKVFEEKVRNKEVKMSSNVQETLEKIKILESEGKYEQAKQLRKTIQSING
jgi:hypothetical protein